MAWTAYIVSQKENFMVYSYLTDEHEREETRQLYTELHNNVEVSDVACEKPQNYIC